MNPKFPIGRTSRHSRGYTLVEMLVTVGLIGVVTLGLLSFTMQSMRIYFYDSGRLMVNKDIRTFTSDLATDAVASNYFRIYPDFQHRDTAVTDGNSGEFLVLIFTDSNVTTGAILITQLVGYYRDPKDPTDPTSLGPVRKFNFNIATADQGKSLPDLLTQYAPTTASSSNPVVIQLAQGLSDGNLFYDYYDRSIMIRGQIVDYGSKGGRAAINTYNFTVSPRG